ncbi:Protein N-acetyltransferase, RimJ/RimL family [Microbacterium azadirachtae]|uniref:Protein N-acetyltransferase, RimJ/RimL family n=1 Tax=Microbacterium azadirachtae TaxID=582680 RepID=A0A1I6IMQ0_9MICO|nr:GNAT family protein [Microbacterium azadirachtae]SFR67996.1 Protein N-acetyltransferase, RimJ/RimL family [Microbacterium azadirachtae]
MDFAAPVTLENDFVRLEPLAPAHAADLAAATAGLEDRWYTSVPSAAGVPAEIERRRGMNAEGSMNPFAIIRTDTGRAVGMTTYCDIDQPNRTVEIGYTWLSPEVHGTAVNPSAKRLLLAHAFETCAANRVQFCTHFHNRQSRAAIERLGAKLDGILRNHRVGADGALRDTVVYSILPHEWPAVRNGLDARLERRR